MCVCVCVVVWCFIIFFFLFFFNLVKNKFALICKEKKPFHKFHSFQTVILSPIQWFGSLRLYDPYVILLGRNYICVFFKKKLNFFFFFYILMPDPWYHSEPCQVHRSEKVTISNIFCSFRLRWSIPVAAQKLRLVGHSSLYSPSCVCCVTVFCGFFFFQKFYFSLIWSKTSLHLFFNENHKF